MPKKHRQTYQSKPGSNYVHPSLGGGASRTGENAQEKPVLSVNERLTKLRIAQRSLESNERKRQLAELSNQRSLPPSLGQGILGQSAVAAPPPRSSASQRSRVRLRTPGPAPPPSWVSRLTSHRQALENRYYPAKRQPRTYGPNGAPTRNVPQGLARFLNMANDNPVTPGSLLDMSLKVAARNWSNIVEDCGEWLDVLPPHLRVVLLSYLTTLGPQEGVDMAGLNALFPNPSEASSLDLSGLVGWGFTLKELRKWLHISAEDSRKQVESSQKERSDVVDSWDQDSSSEDSDFSIPSSLTNNLQHLTKLSLAQPPSSASWTDLLLLSKDLPTITHLSLAHWPLPTRTPNSTSPYASLDRDFEEPALVLRILAENTYCLRWLDLQGCHSWLLALIHRSYALGPQDTSNDTDKDWFLSAQRLKGPDFTSSWRHLTYLNLSQETTSWFPTNASILKSPSFRHKIAKSYYRIGIAHQQIIDDVRDYISLHPESREYQVQHCGTCHATSADFGDCGQECGDCGAYLDVFVGLMARWLEREQEARMVARRIIAARVGTGLRCTFDHGWQTRESYPVLHWG